MQKSKREVDVFEDYYGNPFKDEQSEREVGTAGKGRGMFSFFVREVLTKIFFFFCIYPLIYLLLFQGRGKRQVLYNNIVPNYCYPAVVHDWGFVFVLRDAQKETGSKSLQEIEHVSRMSQVCRL